MTERSRSIESFIEQLEEESADMNFSHTMDILEKNYNFTPVAFSNGQHYNNEGENNGSCKIFYFGQLHDLSKEETLKCFGEFYREVAENPEGEGHQNIRNFMRSGWEGIKFYGKALQLK